MQSSVRLLAILLLFLQWPADAQELTQQLPIDPSVTVGKLENGLTYYIRQNHRPEDKVELRLVVNAGSILEDDDQQGLAHFTEHMAFNGSRNFEKNELVSFLQSIGVEFGADLNAYTSFDETVYILPIPTNRSENIDKAFEILEDWASAVTFDDAEIEKERGVVLEEERSGRGAQERMFRQTYPKILEGSKYAARLPIGTVEVLRNFKPETLRKFYRDWYRPDLMAVIVVGDIDPSKAETLIRKHFGHLQNPGQVRERTYADVPERQKSEGLVVTDKEATHHLVDINFAYKPARQPGTYGAYREYLLRQLFTSMLNQRMQELTQQENPPFLYAANTFSGLPRGFEGYNPYAYVGAAGVETALRAVVAENERARRFGFTEAELERTKKMMLKAIDRAYNERDKTESARLAGEYIRHFLKGEPIPGVENEYKYYQKFLAELTLDTVNAYVARIIPGPQAAKLVILTGPEKADFPIPTGDELLRMTEEAYTQEIEAYDEKVIATTLMEALPKTGKIVKQSVNQALGTTTLTLSNNITVIAKPTDFKNDEIVLTATRPGGQYHYDTGDRVSAEYAATIVGQMGIGQFSPIDLRKALAGRSVNVSPRIGTISEGINGQSSAGDLETMFQLVHLYFTAPRRDPALFQSFITKQQAAYQNLTADPEYGFQVFMLKKMYGDHPWAPRIPTPQTFTEIKLDRSLDIYRERFGNASGFTFVITGAFSLDSLEPLIETYLASLPAVKSKPAYRDVRLRPSKGPLKAEFERGTEPKSLVRLFWNGETPYNPDEQMHVQGLVEVMNIRLIENLREEMGGIYGAGMYGQLNKHPYENYSFGITIPCGPENVDPLIEATLDEIRKIQANGPTETDLNKVKETWKQQYRVNIKDNGFWARAIIQSIENGTDPMRILSYPDRVDALTADHIRKAALKYLDPEKRIQFVLNPEGQ